MKKTSLMRKVLIFTALLLIGTFSFTVSAEEGVEINETNFPDEAFREFVKQYDTDEDQVLSPFELAAVKEMECYSKDIESLTGIEFFTSLTGLWCGENQLTELDLRYNTKLEWLLCDENRLTKLSLSQNTKLQELYCRNNFLTELNISKNPELYLLECGGNQLTSLDLSGNPKLLDLRCEGNRLTSLTLRKNTVLEEIHCEENQLEVLDLSQCYALKKLDCWENRLTSLDFKNNVSLNILQCSDNQLSSLNLSNNTRLETLSCPANRLEKLDLSSNTALNILVCNDNPMKTLDISHNSNIVRTVKEGTRGTDTIFNYYDYIWYVPGAGGDYYTDYYVRVDIGLILLLEGNPFADIKDSKYYFVPVMWAYYHEPRITGGTDDTHFSPSKVCTRAQAVTFLWRLKGCPEPESSETAFIDVNPDKFYYKAMLWAVENEITTGTDSEHFSPNDPCTRGQVVTFLWRAEGCPKPGMTESPFKDAKSGKYYYDAMLWAVENNITTGTSATTFEPNTECIRGQVVTFLYRSQAGN